MSNPSPIVGGDATINADDGFCARLQALLEHEGISQNELARRIGTTSAYISAIIRGKSKPGLELLQRIGACSDVSMDWLISGKGALRGLPIFSKSGMKILALRAELARLAHTGDSEASMVLAELLGEAPKKQVVTQARKNLLDQLKRAISGTTLTAEFYAQFPDIDRDEKQLEDATRALMRHFKTEDSEAISSMLYGPGRDSKI